MCNKNDPFNFWENKMLLPLTRNQVLEAATNWIFCYLVTKTNRLNLQFVLARSSQQMKDPAISKDASNPIFLRAMLLVCDLKEILCNVLTSFKLLYILYFSTQNCDIFSLACISLPFAGVCDILSNWMKHCTWSCRMR